MPPPSTTCLSLLDWQITVEALPWEEYLAALAAGEFDLYYGEVRLSPTYDLGIFFREGGDAAYGGLANSTTYNLCAAMLENSGNAYDLYKRVMEQGYFCPVLYKTYALYATRGSVQSLSPALDWVIRPATPAAAES